MKDLRTQSIALIVKTIPKASQDDEPWNIMVRHNLSRGHPCGAKFWGDLDALYLLALEGKIVIGGSNVFKSLWKSWLNVRPLLGTI